MAEYFKAYTEWLSNLNLPDCKCGCNYAIIAPTDGTAHASVRCANADCNKFFKWLAKPKNADKKTRTDTKGLIEKFSKGYCELCLRNAKQLPRGQVLHAHHVIPKVKGGNEDKENIWIVCTKCHRYIHHERTYLGHYHCDTEDFEANLLTEEIL